MDIPVHDQDPLKGEIVNGIMGADGHVIEEAETHGPIPFGMVAGRPDKGKSVFHLSLPDGPDQFTQTSGSQGCGFE